MSGQHNPFRIESDYRDAYRPSAITPEVSLWRSVIVLACQDAHAGEGVHRETARRFLAGNGLRKAMELALLPVEGIDAVRRWVPEPIPKRAASKRDRRRYLEYAGQRLTLVEWGKTTGIRQEAIRSRLFRGWTPGQALGFDPKPEKLPGIMRQQVARDARQATRWAARNRSHSASNTQSAAHLLEAPTRTKRVDIASATKDSPTTEMPRGDCRYWVHSGSTSAVE